MKNKYESVMKNIQVTEEMRERILNNISALEEGPQTNKVTFFQGYNKYLSIAACFIFLVIGSLGVYHVVTIQEQDQDQLQGMMEIVEVESARELSDYVGFEVKVLKALSFEVDNVRYSSYNRTLAQIEYSGANHTLTFRMAQREEDISGDYTSYSDIEEYRLDDYVVTLKGDEGSWNLAIWTVAGYSYSIRIEEGMTEGELLGLIQSIE